MIPPLIVSREENPGREVFAEKARSNGKPEKKDPFASFLFARRDMSENPLNLAAPDTSVLLSFSGNISLPLKAAEEITGEGTGREEAAWKALVPAAEPGADEGAEEAAAEESVNKLQRIKPPEELISCAGAASGSKQQNTENPSRISARTTGRTESGLRGEDSSAVSVIHVPAASGEGQPGGALKKAFSGEQKPLPSSGVKTEEGPQTTPTGRGNQAKEGIPGQTLPMAEHRPEAAEPDRPAILASKAEAREGQAPAKGGELHGDGGKEGGRPGEKGESRNSYSPGHDSPGISFVNRGQDHPAGGLRTNALPPSAGFVRELELAGRGGAALEDGVGNVVRFMRAEGRHRASIIVDPPALGRVEVELASGTAGVEASIRVASEQLKQFVQDHIAQLRLHLQQQGVQLTGFTVDISDHGKEGRRETGGRAGGGNLSGASRLSPEDEEMPVCRVDLEQGLLHWMA